MQYATALFTLALGTHVAAAHGTCNGGSSAAATDSILRRNSLGRARALVHVACKMLCNKLHKLVSDKWSKRKSMWDGTGRFAIGKKRARSVRHLCVERARAGRTTGAW